MPIGATRKSRSPAARDTVAAWISEQLKQMTERGGTAPAVSDTVDLDEEILRWIRREERERPAVNEKPSRE